MYADSMSENLRRDIYEGPVLLTEDMVVLLEDGAVAVPEGL